MPRRKQAKRTTVKDTRTILRLTYEQGLTVRPISERLQLSKTSVSTYPTQTPGLSQLASRNQDGHSKEDLAATIPLGRLGTAEECANAVLFLASDEASFVTGIELSVDGSVGQI